MSGLLGSGRLWQSNLLAGLLNTDPIYALPPVPLRYGQQLTMPDPNVTNAVPVTTDWYAMMRRQPVTTPQGNARGEQMANMLSGFAGTATPGNALAAQGIRAYHGSPHEFNRFRMSRIGTGEGAQAYGHGLYFAENEDVARQYRNALTAGINPRVRVDGQNPFTSREFSSLQVRGLDQFERSRMDSLPDFIAQLRAGGSDGVADALQPFVGRITREVPGHMYEVNLRVDPQRLLDWDAPLSQQSQAVRDALNETLRWQRPAQNALDAHRNAYGEPTGQHIYSALRGVVQGDEGPRFAMEELRANGIPGIQYFDQGSRAAGQGTRNYVMFDDNLIDIVRRYGIAGLLAGGGAGLLGQPAQAGQ